MHLPTHLVFLIPPLPSPLLIRIWENGASRGAALDAEFTYSFPFPRTLGEPPLKKRGSREKPRRPLRGQAATKETI